MMLSTKNMVKLPTDDGKYLFYDQVNKQIYYILVEDTPYTPNIKSAVYPASLALSALSTVTIGTQWFFVKFLIYIIPIIVILLGLHYLFKKNNAEGAVHKLETKTYYRWESYLKKHKEGSLWIFFFAISSLVGFGITSYLYFVFPSLTNLFISEGTFFLFILTGPIIRPLRLYRYINEIKQLGI